MLVTTITVILIGMKEYNNSNPNVDMVNNLRWFRPSLEDDGDWRDKAACLDVDDPELFFPVGSRGPAAIQIEKAKAYCNTCVSRLNCLAYAVEHGPFEGVWGGLSDKERKGIKKRRVDKLGRVIMFNVNDLN